MKLKRIKDWKLFSKLISLVLFTVIPFISIIVFYVLPVAENNLLKEREINLTALVSARIGILENYEFKVDPNELLKDEAQKLALNSINKLRYAEGDYFWINNLNCKMIMHPIKPELNGKDLIDFKDPEGYFLFRNIVEQVRKKDSGQVVKETVDRMHRITDAVESSSLIIQNLGKSSNQIGKINQVIEDIAEQTNLLALNSLTENFQELIFTI